MKFGRVIRAKILLSNSGYSGYSGEIDIENLRFTFNIQKTLSNSCNTCSLRIYNLSSDKRNRLRAFGDQLRLFAGYVDDGGEQLIFIGNINNLSHSFDNPEIVTHVECGDGEKNINNTLISASFGERTPKRAVIRYVAEKMNFPIAYFAESENLVYQNGFSAVDYAKKILDDACAALNLSWSVQNDKLLILPTNGATPRPPVEVSAETGMLGVPERYVDKSSFLYLARAPNEPPKPGWRVRTLLTPDLLPGDRIRLISKQIDIDGVFRIRTINHQGDNWGSQFESTLEVYPL